jgi:hypothetical protein
LAFGAFAGMRVGGGIIRRCQPRTGFDFGQMGRK